MRATPQVQKKSSNFGAGMSSSFNSDASLVRVTIHHSQFPERIQADLRQSLAQRQIAHKFHYDSYKQTQRWLQLHETYSPSRTDPNCNSCYDASFVAAASLIQSSSVHLIGLGCGGGQKDTRLLELLKGKARRLIYSPVDVSTAMVLTAHQTASRVVGAEINPFVCDLSSMADLADCLDDRVPKEAARLITFFGMLPNFEPQSILPQLARFVRPADVLLLSANLAPGTDYATGLRRVLPQYDNPLTNDWLSLFLLDLGVEKSDGQIQWSLEPCPSGNDLQRITASFTFHKPRSFSLATDPFHFHPGDKIHLFFSYRYTPELLKARLAVHGLSLQQEWITPSEEEAVFLILV